MDSWTVEKILWSNPRILVFNSLIMYVPLDCSNGWIYIGKSSYIHWYFPPFITIQQRAEGHFHWELRLVQGQTALDQLINPARMRAAASNYHIAQKYHTKSFYTCQFLVCCLAFPDSMKSPLCYELEKCLIKDERLALILKYIHLFSIVQKHNLLQLSLHWVIMLHRAFPGPLGWG